MPSNHLILCCHLLLLPSVFPRIRVFSSESDLFQWVGSSHQVAKYCSFSFSSSPSNEHSDLISLRIDSFDLLAVQRTLRVSTTVQKHPFFGTQPSLWAIFHIHAITTGKTITLTVWTFVGKVLFNMLSRFVIVFLQRTSVFNFMPGVIICSDFGAQKNKISVTVCTFPLLFAITWWDWMPWS